MHHKFLTPHHISSKSLTSQDRAAKPDRPAGLADPLVHSVNLFRAIRIQLRFFFASPELSAIENTDTRHLVDENRVCLPESACRAFAHSGSDLRWLALLLLLSLGSSEVLQLWAVVVSLNVVTDLFISGFP